MMIPVLLRALSLPSSAQRHYHERSGHQRVPLGKSPRARAEGVVGEGDREAATISKLKKREEQAGPTTDSGAVRTATELRVGTL